MQKPPNPSATRRGPAKRLYSMHALLRGQEFVGSIDDGGRSADFRFRVKNAGITRGKLELVGLFSVIGSGGRARTADRVTATLAAIQSAVGSAPPAPGVFAARINPGATPSPELPFTESSDSSGYVGVLYFHLSQMNARTLGVNLDLSRVQLNLRLSPVTQSERELQWLFSAASGALLGPVKDEGLAQEYLTEIIRILSL